MQIKLSPAAQRVLRILKETGPAKVIVIAGLVGDDHLTRVVGELFIVDVVEWVGAKRGRRLAARSA